MPQQLMLGWGSGAEGQLGPSASDISPTPRLISVPTPTAFGAGLWTSAFVTYSGEAVYQTTAPPPSPTKIELVPGTAAPPDESVLPPFNTVAIGRDFALLLTNAGDVYAIGAGAYGQLGHGPDVATLTFPSQVNALGNTRIVALAASEFHWLALDASGRVFACGKNSAGELAFQCSPRVDKPRVVQALWPHPVVAVATGDMHSVVLTACGTVLAFGSNKHGQLGHIVSAVQVCSTTPVPVPLPEAVLRNKRGEGGDVEMVDTPESAGKRAEEEEEDSYDRFDEVLTYTDVACGSSHTVALLSDASLATWGKGENGQLGTRTAQNLYVPTPVSSPARFVSVDAGHEHSAALAEDGIAYLWGDGSCGQIGDGDVSGKFLPVPLRSPMLVSPNAHDKDVEMVDRDGGVLRRERRPSFRFLKLSCGGHHTLGLVSDDPTDSVYSAPQAYRNRIPKCRLDDMVQAKAGLSRFGSAAVLLHTFVRPNLKPLAKGKVKFRAMDTAYSAFVRLFGSEARRILGLAAARIRHEAQVAFGLVIHRGKDHPFGPEKYQEEDDQAPRLVTPKDQFVSSDILFRSSVANCYECGYLFLLAMLNPIYEEGRRELAELAALLLRCEENAREAFLEMVSYCPKDLLVSRLIRPLQTLLSEELKGYNRVRRNAKLATKALALCYHGVWRASRREKVRDLVVPRKEFYNQTVSELMDLREDYDRWISGQGNRKSSSGLTDLPPLPTAGQEEYLFSFCTYSFLLSESAKFQILGMESHQTMSHESMRSVLSFGQLPMPLGILGQVSHLRLPPEQVAHLQYLVLHVRRDNIVSDAFLQIADLAQKQPRELHKPLKVVFDGEDGVDEGGVRKEFYQVLLEQILSPDYGMYEYDEDTRYHWFRKDSLEPNHSWTLIGIMLGLAAFNSIILDVQFPPVVYRKLQVALRNNMLAMEANRNASDGSGEGQEMLLPEREEYRADLDDVKETFPAIGNSLEQLLSYDGDDVEDVFALSFEISYEGLFGKVNAVELVPNGAKKPVTSGNRKEFVSRYCEYLINESIELMFNNFALGFSLMLNGPFVHSFSADELETLLIGEKELDFNALRNSAKYEGYTERSTIVQHLWQVLMEYDEETKRLFLAFVTGTDRSPIGGLEKLVLVIQRAEGDSNRLPTSHTCFNVLLLPEYATRAKLRDRLSTAIRNSKGFGLR